MYEDELKKEIAGIKAEMRKLKDDMERPGKDLTPEPDQLSIERLDVLRRLLADRKASLAESPVPYEPDEAEIRAAALLDNLPYLRKLSFSLGGFFGLPKQFTVEENGDRLKVTDALDFTFPFLPVLRLGFTPAKLPPLLTNMDALRAYLRELHVEEWMREYTPDRFGHMVLDGTQWELRLEFSNGAPDWEAWGSNSYPYNFEDFQALFGMSFYDDGKSDPFDLL